MGYNGIMAMTIRQLIDRLSELPDDWEVWATRSGKSLEVHEPTPNVPGHRYGYVFTDPSKEMILFQTQRGGR